MIHFPAESFPDVHSDILLNLTSIVECLKRYIIRSNLGLNLIYKDNWNYFTEK